MNNIWTYVMTHPAAVSGVTLFLYHIASAFVDSLPMPNTQSSNFYRFVFNFTNVFAANYSRAGASRGPAGQQPPKENT